MRKAVNPGIAAIQKKGSRVVAEGKHMPWSAVTASSTLFWRQVSARRPSGTSMACTVRR